MEHTVQHMCEEFAASCSEAVEQLRERREDAMVMRRDARLRLEAAKRALAGDRAEAVRIRNRLRAILTSEQAPQAAGD